MSDLHLSANAGNSKENDGIRCNKDSNGERSRLEIVEQLEAARRIAKETIYETKNYNHLFLLGAEVTRLYARKLLDDGSSTFEEQSVIFKDIERVSEYIIATIDQATGELDRIREK